MSGTESKYLRRHINLESDQPKMNASAAIKRLSFFSTQIEKPFGA